MWIKTIICAVVGHKLEEPSIVNTLCSNNWLKRCSRCGFYIMHGDIGSVHLTERQAYKVKREFEEEFPYSVKVGGAEDGGKRDIK